MLIIGEVEDQIASIVWGQISNVSFQTILFFLGNGSPLDVYFANYLNPLSSSQPVLWFFVSLFLTFLGSNGYNLLLLLTTLINLVVGYLFFKRFKFGILLTLLFVFSPFYFSHLGRHIDLMQIWTIPLFFIGMEKFNVSKISLVACVKMALLIVLIALISNYLAFFLIFVFITKMLFTLVKNIYIKKSYIHSLFNYTFVLCLSGVLLVLILFPFFEANYISDDPVDASKKISRTLDDFIGFSSRPWYYIIPPIKNPFLGEISINVLEKIESTGYFLADDYFALEHSSNYLSIIMLVSCLFLFLLVRKRVSSENRASLVFYICVILMLIVISMPPYISIQQHEFLLPSFLLHKYFPMFRVLARTSSIIYFLVITIFGCLITVLFKDIHLKKAKVAEKVLIFLTVAILLEVYIPIKTHSITNIPSVYTYMKENLNASDKFVIYPYEETNRALLWLPIHQREFINPRGFFNSTYNSEKLTKNLFLPASTEVLRKLNASFLVYVGKPDAREEQLISNSWELVFSDPDYQLYRLKPDLEPILVE